MPLDPVATLSKPAIVREQSYSERDVILYALGLGLGRDPIDSQELKYLYEKNLQVLPTYPVVLAAMSVGQMNLGINYTRLVHVEQRLVIHRPMQTAGTVVGSQRVTDVIDRGREKGALIVVDREILDKASGELLATAGLTVLCRADGGFSDAIRPSEPVPEPPARKPDHSVILATSPRAGLIYRLSGDLNPVHIDPDVARSAGFERPLLHGLATYGMMGWAIIKSCCEGSGGARLKELDGRFSQPVFPGDTLRIDIWSNNKEIVAQVIAVERNVTVLKAGRALLD